MRCVTVTFIRGVVFADTNKHITQQQESSGGRTELDISAIFVAIGFLLVLVRIIPITPFYHAVLVSGLLQYRPIGLYTNVF